MTNPSIDSKVRIAIYSYLQQIIKTQSDQFLSFPGYAPLSFEAEQLDALALTKGFDEVAAGLTRQGEFSLLVNRPPKGLLFDSADDGYFLWDAFKHFTENALVAESSLDDDEMKAYQDDYNYLYGSNGDSEAYKLYKAYEERYKSAKKKLEEKKSNYAQHKDDGSKIELEEAEKDLKDIEADWEIKGNKKAIEDCINRLILSNKSDASFFLKKVIDDHKSFVLTTDPTSNINYAPSYIFPADLSKMTDWNQKTIDQDNIESLLQRAPKELVEIMGGQEALNSDSRIKKVTFEWRSAGINRPWFKKEAMTSRYWKFLNTNSEILFSYGTDNLKDDKGRFPAYVSSLILVRNIEVEKIIETTPEPQAHNNEIDPHEIYVAPDVSGGRIVKPKGPAPELIRNPGTSDGPRNVIRREHTGEVGQGSNGRRGGIRRRDSDSHGPSFKTSVSSNPNNDGPISRPTTSRSSSYNANSAGGRVDHPIGKGQYIEGFDQQNQPQQTEPQPKPDIETEEIKDNHITIAAYICSRFGLCPNPSPDAKWPIGLGNDHYLTFNQSTHGKIHATVNDNKIYQNYPFSKGQRIILNAVPDPGYIIKSWIINEEQVDAKGNDYPIEMPEGGLNVTAVWQEGKMTEDGAVELSADGKTLTKWAMPDSDVDMNEYGNLAGVTTIASNAFNGCPNLRKIRIGNSVHIISAHAFSNCEQLSIVELPESVLEIDDTAFEHKRYDGGPNFIVNEANKRYTAVDGMLVEKDKTGRVKGFNCENCSFTAFIPVDGANAPTTCPYCGHPLVPADERTIIMPEAYLPFKLSEAAAKEAAMDHYHHMNFMKEGFIEAAQKSITLKQMYLPVWDFSVTGDADYSVKIKKEKIEEVTNADGTKKQNIKYDIETKNGHVSDDFKDLALTASKIYPAKPILIPDAAPLTPNDDLWNSSIPIEQYTITPREGTKSIIDEADSKLLELAKKRSEAYYNGEFKMNTIYTKLKHRLVMRPVWIGSVEFEGQTYPVFVSGYKGGVSGNTEYATDNKKQLKVAAYILGGLIAIGIIAYLISAVMNKNSTDSQVSSGTNTEQVVTPSESSSGSSSGNSNQNYNTVNRPSSSNTVTRPSTTNQSNSDNGNNQNYNTARRPSSSNTVTRPSTTNQSNSDNGNNQNYNTARRPNSSNTVTRPSTNNQSNSNNGNNQNYNTVRRPNSSNTVTRPSTNNQSGYGQEANQGQSNNSNSGNNGSRGGNRRR